MGTSSSLPVNKLSVVTWNVWSDPLEQNIRYESILTICQELQPDVICFQEVIGDFIQRIKNTPYFYDNYVCSDPKFNSATLEPCWYGVLMLTKKIHPVTYKFYKLPTIYGGYCP